MKRICKIALYCLLIGTVLLGIGEKARSSSPVFDEERFASMRKSMVDKQIKRRGVKDVDVLNAMLSVPRHLFVPEKSIYRAYNDSPLPIGYGQTISQPYIVAYMTEILNLDRDSVVLEVGTGSGYQAAILSVLVKKVYSVEIISDLAESAAERLQRLEYTNVEVKHGDGYYGWPEHAPFDAVIVTAAAGHVPPPLMEQLKNGGRMIIPVGGAFMTQSLVLVMKDETGNVTTQNMMLVIFVPLTGDHK